MQKFELKNATIENIKITFQMLNITAQKRITFVTNIYLHIQHIIDSKYPILICIITIFFTQKLILNYLITH